MKFGIDCNRRKPSATDADEYSGFFVRKTLGSEESGVKKGKNGNVKFKSSDDDPLCSLGSSNDPNETCDSSQEIEDDSAYPCEDDVEEVSSERKSSAGRTLRTKTVCRSARDRHLFKKKKRGRDRIDGKIQILRRLIPNCHEADDQVSMLDEAIEYLKTLQLHLQIMHLRSRACNHRPIGLGLTSMSAGNAAWTTMMANNNNNNIRGSIVGGGAAAAAAAAVAVPLTMLPQMQMVQASGWFQIQTMVGFGAQPISFSPAPAPFIPLFRDNMAPTCLQSFPRLG